MTHHTPMFIAAGLALAVLAAPAAAQDAGSVVIYRGAQAETVRFADRSGVTVVRGQPAPDASRVGARGEAIEKRRHARAFAGDTLWIVDGEIDRIFACETRRTTQVGGLKIRCISRELPVALRR